MSRHRFVKAMNVQDEFTDFDGGDAEQEEQDPQDLEQLRVATQEAKTLLGPSFSDKEVGEAVWHYYFDVEKAVNYLLKKHTATKEKKQNPVKKQPNGPSPDDVVAKAQGASKGFTKKSVEDVSKKMEQTTLEKAPRVKSKNLNVVAEYEKQQRKNSANFVVIGHVDAGKSTLMGRLLHDLSVVDDRTLNKYRKEADIIGKSSFALAWVMDNGTEERQRGVTIDIATNQFETEKTKFTILDAPGHRDFVPNMIAGASQADFAVLVVDASGNNFESGLKGQTKEHALLVRSLGIKSVVVAVNKLDAATWSQPRFDEITQQSSAFLTAAGFSPANVAFVPCSGLLGDNVTRRASAAEASWYTGNMLLDELDAHAAPRDFAVRGPLRMAVTDVEAGGPAHALSLWGRITSGSLQTGDAVVVVPAGTAGYVRAIEVDGAPADWAVAGQNALLHLGDADPELVRRGDVVCGAADPIRVRGEFTLKALAFEHVTPMFVSVIVGRTDVQGRVSALVATLDRTSGKVLRKKPKIVKPGEVARLTVAVEGGKGIPLDDGARVVLRAGGETVATGLVE